ncbi:cysteine desulfuration protein SufE [Blochmannia endosymbiont of Colobopsis nipponica]|uniref:cysteine desulfuration protein SufE n=1 Tax=Blochmannia endosymbiont of Colobopsis nipponica TaxID=2681987 RepID=UPI00177F7A44|nr:cysteine desulfuration protein SufE [Blochmannia endosymbiont of Colobopsis nipponica]QOI11082.1 cysteine desulfuration protein SufE [Blochmannia endosymbiont of Colobopsis nipponica]
MNLPNKKKLLQNFLRCRNWEEKYSYIITLGNHLSPIPNNTDIPKYLVPGCQSRTWITVLVDNDGIIKLYGDSNSSIVKGIIAIVFIIYQGLTPKEIIQLKIRFIIKKLNLNENFTFARSEGLQSIVSTLLNQVKNLV